MPPGPRVPAVAGQFYDRNPEALSRQLAECFADPRGPGAWTNPPSRPGRAIRAAVVPHAGYPYSGPIAAHAYAAIGREAGPGAILLLGTNHQGRGPTAALSDREWQTPLGIVETDHDLVRALAHPPCVVEERVHVAEHSIEVQLPFLQYVFTRPRIVALSVRFAPYPELARIGETLRRLLEGRDVLVLASTDFSHYVPEEEARRRDRRAIDAILARDSRRLYETVVNEEISMCGVAPTTVLLAMEAGRPRARARLLAYGHSGEASPMPEVVGYGSIVIESLREGRD